MSIVPSSAVSPRDTAIVVAYTAAAWAAIATTRFGGGVACLWMATAILTAYLTQRSRRRWAVPVLLCLLVGSVPGAVSGFGIAAALPLSALNVGEAVLAALLLRRLGDHRAAIDSIDRLAALFFAVTLAAIASGTLAAAIAARASPLDYWSNLANWIAGHALGSLAFLPIASMILAGELRRWTADASRERLIEAAALLLLVATVTLAVFSQATLPLLFVPILPVILTTFRLGHVGAAGAIVIIAVVGGLLTVMGFGPVNLVAGSAGRHAQFFQFYLAVTVLTALPVAADLARRRRLFEQLRDSEARYRLLTDNSSDIVMNLDPAGCIRFVSPSIAQLGGYEPAAMVGRNAGEFIAVADRPQVVAAHAAALANPAETVIVEYRAATGSGDERWFESHTRAVVDEHGVTTGAVSVIRDITDRKSREAELSQAAATDPLTGLANRRAFTAELVRRLAAGDKDASGCVAIFDLDHFKSVNDRFGHDAGDRVLEAFADVARRSVRDHDLVARLGGEEFGIILAGANAHQASIVCERLRTAVTALRVGAGPGHIGVTVSAGLAPFVSGEPMERVMRAADEALYDAKRAGRNRLSLAA